jgi:hypothetical protein
VVRVRGGDLIEQAKGMVAERAQLSVGDAFVRIRGYARNRNQRLAAVCHAIIDGTISADDLTRTPTHSRPPTPQSTNQQPGPPKD